MKKITTWIGANKLSSVLLVIIITAGGVFGYQHFNAEPERAADEPIVPAFEETQTKEEIEAGVTPGIEIPGYSIITINSGEQKVAVDFYNPENNNVYFKIKLILDDSGETLYESDFFKPGQHLYEIEMTKTMEQGEYDMTIVYETFAMDENYTPRNGANVNCILKVV